MSYSLELTSEAVLDSEKDRIMVLVLSCWGHYKDK